MLVIPALHLTGGIYFLTAFFDNVWSYWSYNYPYCLPVGLVFVIASILTFVLIFNLFKPDKSNMPMEFRTLLTAISFMAVMLWIYMYYNCTWSYYQFDFLNMEFRAGKRFVVLMLWILCLPAAYVVCLMLYGFKAQIRSGCLLENSIVYRSAKRRGRAESVREKAWLYIVLAFECLFAFMPILCGIVALVVSVIYYIFVPVVVCLMTLVYIVLFMIMYYFLLNGKHSLVRDADNAMKEAVEQAVAGEKLKVELITNVSHDLRTPMTSIVGYGEMLERMELSDEACECVRKLNHKSKYLLSMLEDVFDMSKTATGNAVLDMKELDVVMLINQTIAECDDRLEKSGKKLCTDMDCDSVIVRTDGNRMHRVFSNLLDNAIKYSLAGTRIFVNLRTYADKVVVEIMNTSSYEMNFTPERITQRFVRGDSERTGEGSGIGLAIAKTYTEGVGGSFDIELKGDLFSAVVTLPRN